MQKYIAYYRVSTQRQGQSGLGLEAQKETIAKFLQKDDTLVEEYTEIESGRKKNRIELNKAILSCKKNKAILIIAKLDRLARNASFIFTLRESGLKFVACDIPNFDTMTLGIFATFAQFEAEKISQRIKDALAAKKARGERLGSDKKQLKKIRESSLKIRRNNSMIKMQAAYDLSKKMQQEHGFSLNEIARRLNNTKFTSPKGCKFTAKTIANMFKMFERAKHD